MRFRTSWLFLGLSLVQVKLLLVPVLLVFSIGTTGELRAEELEGGFAEQVRERLLEEHRQGLETLDQDAEEHIAKAMRAAEAAGDDEGMAAGHEMLELMELPRLPLAEPEELDQALAGRWRVRSLQASASGCFAYPFFQCTIQREARVLVFHKHTGSQRRFGVLVPDGESRLLFEGSSYYGYEDGPRMYSAMMDEPTDEDRNRDSVAYLYRIGEQRYLGVFLKTRFGVELYEIRK